MKSFFAVMQVYGWEGVDLAVVCFMCVFELRWTLDLQSLIPEHYATPWSRIFRITVSTARSYSSEKCQIVVVVVVFLLGEYHKNVVSHLSYEVNQNC